MTEDLVERLRGYEDFLKKQITFSERQIAVASHAAMYIDATIITYKNALRNLYDTFPEIKSTEESE